MEPKSLERQKSTEGMVDYDRNSAMQRQQVQARAGLVRELAGRIGQVTPEFRIVDYGCGPGATAIEAVRPAIEAYRACYPDVPICVCHADQPGNDWNALFELATGPSGYLDGTRGVRVEAAIGSFYNQQVAEASVDLATCFAASHWLSHAVRLHSPGTVWFADLTGKARQEMAAIARSDWIRFLRCRALELRQGGYLLISTLGSIPEEGEINNTAASGRGIYRAMQVVAQGMAEDGLIDPEVLDGFVFGLWFMTREEAREPLVSDAQLASAFEIEELCVEAAADNPSDIFADSIEDPAEYARLYTGYTHAFADMSVRKQLLEPCSKDQAESERLEQEFFSRLEDLYRRFTNKYACEIWQLKIVLRRA